MDMIISAEEIKVKLEEEIIEQVKNFQYLGTTVIEIGNPGLEVNSRIESSNRVLITLFEQKSQGNINIKGNKDEG